MQEVLSLCPLLCGKNRPADLNAQLSHSDPHQVRRLLSPASHCFACMFVDPLVCLRTRVFAQTCDGVHRGMCTLTGGRPFYCFTAALLINGGVCIGEVFLWQQGGHDLISWVLLAACLCNYKAKSIWK